MKRKGEGEKPDVGHRHISQLVNSERAELSRPSFSKSLSPLSHPLLVDVLSNLYLFLLCKALASLVQIIIPPF